MRTFTLMMIAVISLASCSKEGCTNFTATNYDASATKDDGSCFFSGCTDPTATNYDDDATTDDGSCLYTSDVYFYNRTHIENTWNIEVYWVGDYAGRFLNKCPYDVDDCTSGCETVDILDLEPGTYEYACILKPVQGNSTDTVKSGSVTLGSSQCKHVVIQ